MWGKLASDGIEAIKLVHTWSLKTEEAPSIAAYEHGETEKTVVLMDMSCSAPPVSLFPSLLPAPPQFPLAWSLMLRSHQLQKLYRSVQLPVTLMIWGWLNNFCLKIFKDLLNFLQTTTGSIFTHKIKLLIQQIKAPISKTLNTLWNGSMAAV